MKRMFVFLLVSLLLSCLCCIGFAAAPPQSRITAEIFYSFDDKDDAPFTIDNGNNGWFSTRPRKPGTAIRITALS